MMAQSEIGQENFLKIVVDRFKEFGTDDPLQKARIRAWDQFLELGLPDAKSEVFRYIKLKQLFNRAFTAAPNVKVKLKDEIYPECKQSALVFVNGRYSPELSNTQAIPDKVVISPLNKAIKTYGALLNNAWGKGVRDEIDPFAALNLALHEEGLFIYVPPKTVIETPIQCVHIVDCGQVLAMMMPRIQLFAGMNAELKFLTVLKTITGDATWVNQVLDVALDEGARLQLTQTVEGAQENAWHFDALRASLKRDSNLKTVLVTEGSAAVRNDYKVLLNGENGEALLNGVWMLRDKREAHVHVMMDHQAPNCRSMQLYKGVLNDFSRSGFEGKIMVRKPAQKTQAFQLNNNLLLSDRANADSKPNLEIFADDVKASHGATVGQVDAEQLFYMKTRGFSEVDAKNLLVYGFCQEVIGMIPVPSVLEEVSKRAKAVLQ